MSKGPTGIGTRARATKGTGNERRLNDSGRGRVAQRNYNGAEGAKVEGARRRKRSGIGRRRARGTKERGEQKGKR